MKRSKRRKKIPDGAKLDSCLRRFGLTRADVQFDHNPALELRDWNPLTNDTIPPANDPAYIDMLLVSEHAVKTFGPGGEKRITTAGSDINRIAKVKRISREQEDFRKRLQAKADPEVEPPPKKKTKWPKRQMRTKKTVSKNSS